jgi:biotin carboxylase
LKTAVVFLDARVSGWIDEITAASRALGHHTILLGLPSQRERLAGLVDEFFETEDWSIDSMREFRDRMLSRDDIDVVAFGTAYGIMNPTCMHGPAVAQLAAEVGLPHPNVDGLYRSNNKFLMRDALGAAAVPSVRHALVRTAEEARAMASTIGFPLILKPVNMAGSSFVCRCDDMESLERKVNYLHEHIPSSPLGVMANYSYEWPDRQGQLHQFDGGSLLMEQYIPGIEATVECIALADRVIPLILTEKPILTEQSYTVLENLGISPPVSFCANETEAIKNYAADVIRAVGVTNTFVHVELRYSRSSGPLVLEVNPRLGGGVAIGKAIRMFTGVDAARTSVELLTGEFQPLASYPVRDDVMIGFFVLYPPHGGILEEVTGLDQVRELPGVVELNLTAPVGSTIPGDHEECFLVTCMLTAKTADQLTAVYRRAHALARFRVRRSTGG